MSFDVIPAIDLKNGKCVRLLRGNEHAVTEYSDDPPTVARQWETQGAKRLHVVNLDGAFGTASDNLSVLEKIVGAVNLQVQFGGGIRSGGDALRAFDLGVARVVLGSAVVDSPEMLDQLLARYGSDRVIVALDAVRGFLATHGWKTVTNLSIHDVARDLKHRGVTDVLYTNVDRDGTMNGPDVDGSLALARTGLRVIASGGVSGHDDVLTLAQHCKDGISSVIVGKALYEGRIDLPVLMKEVA